MSWKLCDRGSPRESKAPALIRLSRTFRLTTRLSASRTTSKIVVNSPFVLADGDQGPGRRLADVLDRGQAEPDGFPARR